MKYVVRGKIMYGLPFVNFGGPTSPPGGPRTYVKFADARYVIEAESPELAAEKAAEIHHEVFMFKHKSVKLLKGGETKRPAEASPLANDSVVE